MKPDVSCLCLTHGRPWLLAEAVESFRRQKLGGLKAELVIINDCPEQQIICDVPGIVVVVNLDQQVMDLATKTNIALAKAGGKYACLWDDDDISLPDRIVDGVTRMGNKLAYRPTLCWSWSCGEIRHMGEPLFCAGMFDREFIVKAGGCPHGEWNDKGLWGRLFPTRNVVQYEPKPTESQYIYRWGGIGWHESGSGEQNSTKRAAAFHKAALADPRFRRGGMEITPMWKHDYVQQVKEAIRNDVGAKRK